MIHHTRTHTGTQCSSLTGWCAVCVQHETHTQTDVFILSTSAGAMLRPVMATLSCFSSIQAQVLHLGVSDVKVGSYGTRQSRSATWE